MGHEKHSRTFVASDSLQQMEVSLDGNRPKSTSATMNGEGDMSNHNSQHQRGIADWGPRSPSIENIERISSRREKKMNTSLPSLVVDDNDESSASSASVISNEKRVGTRKPAHAQEDQSSMDVITILLNASKDKSTMKNSSSSTNLHDRANLLIQQCEAVESGSQLAKMHCKQLPTSPTSIASNRFLNQRNQTAESSNIVDFTRFSDLAPSSPTAALADDLSSHHEDEDETVSQHHATSSYRNEPSSKPRRDSSRRSEQLQSLPEPPFVSPKRSLKPGSEGDLAILEQQIQRKELKRLREENEKMHKSLLQCQQAILSVANVES
jgi:hypothetical protein